MRPICIDEDQCVRVAEYHLNAVGRPREVIVLLRTLRQRRQVGPVRIHHVDVGLVALASKGNEGDLLAIRRPGWTVDAPRQIGETHTMRPVRVHEVDLPSRFRVKTRSYAREGNSLSVRRPGWSVVQGPLGR